MVNITPRQTFAIISHPDAGKTTLTEKLLLFGGAIQLAGTIKGRKAGRHATSDWMALEQQRGISVTTSVMQFPYQDSIINLLDTPGHADFSEDTYRTLTAVDSALMVIDAVKGVEDRTIKLLEICRLRNMPIMTFINKLDRDSREPLELIDEIESVLNIQCAPITWPIGMGKSFAGVYHLIDDEICLYQPGKGHTTQDVAKIAGLNSDAAKAALKSHDEQFNETLELVQGASLPFSQSSYLTGQQTPVFFGSAINNFGIKELLDMFVKIAPKPQPQPTTTRMVEPEEEKFSGFVFKIQANMDPQHHDRIAFVRVCSGHYYNGIKTRHCRLGRDTAIRNALTFMAGAREHVDEAWPGDIIGVHSHGSLQIGDTFTQGEALQFTGIPYFAPELFRLVRLRDPLKLKALQKGLQQLSEEGAVQLFKPLTNNDLILGAVGILQFDVVAHRLQHEYKVECSYDNTTIATARWIRCQDNAVLKRFKDKNMINLALDGSDQLIYLAPSNVNLQLTMERNPEVEFCSTREHAVEG